MDWGRLLRKLLLLPPPASTPQRRQSLAREAEEKQFLAENAADRHAFQARRLGEKSAQLRSTFDTLLGRAAGDDA